MNALFYFAGCHPYANVWNRFLLTVPDGPHDRYEHAKGVLVMDYPELSRCSGTFVCLTPEDVFKELPEHLKKERDQLRAELGG